MIGGVNFPFLSPLIGSSYDSISSLWEIIWIDVGFVWYGSSFFLWKGDLSEEPELCLSLIAKANKCLWFGNQVNVENCFLQNEPFKRGDASRILPSLLEEVGQRIFQISVCCVPERHFTNRWFQFFNRFVLMNSGFAVRGDQRGYAFFELWCRRIVWTIDHLGFRSRSYHELADQLGWVCGESFLFLQNGIHQLEWYFTVNY